MITLHRRFVERNYMLKKILDNSEYITEREATEMLDQMNVQWCDLTFKFKLTSTGFQTAIVNNVSEREIKLNDLNDVAYDYYLRQVKDISVKRIKEMFAA